MGLKGCSCIVIDHLQYTPPPLLPYVHPFNKCITTNKTQNKNYSYKVTILKYNSYSRHIQFLGTHFLIFCLKSAKSLIVLRSLGTIVSHTMGPNHLKNCSPLQTVLTFGLVCGILHSILI